jgi:DNA-binding transcriptional MocR family regulator
LGQSHRVEEDMKDWIPQLPDSDVPRYLALVQALEESVASGTVKVGTQLLPHREMASRLGVSVGTVTKAYSEAERRGLVSGEVGRGTFVRGRNVHREGLGSSASVNLALNVPPRSGEDAIVAAALSEIVESRAIDDLLGYLPHQGLRRHREAVARWLSFLGVEMEVDRLFITSGAQHALSVAVSVIASASEPLLTETFTYSGMLSLAAQMRYRLHPVAVDEYGLLPDALDRAFAETRARALYCMPTLQTPTGSIMPADRRAEIAAVIRKHDSYLLEDDAYVFLPKPTPPPISRLIPERSFYIVSFAKCLAPGLRVGAMVVPDVLRSSVTNAVRATGWMAAPIMVEVVARLIENGEMARQVDLKREKSEIRADIAHRILREWLPKSTAPTGFHIWLPLPAGRSLTGLIAEAARAGITLAPPEGAQRLDRRDLGIRLCLGGAPSEAELQSALTEIQRILESTESISLV